jgi:hypothetical protein
VTVQPTTEQLHARLAHALRAAAHDCDGTCGLDERECLAEHPIQVAYYDASEIGGVEGTVHSLATVTLAAIQPELDRLRETHRRDLLAAETSAGVLQEQINAQAAELDRLRAELAGRDERIEQLSAGCGQLSAAVRDQRERAEQATAGRDRYRTAWHSARRRAADRTGELDTARERLANYGSPIVGPVPVPQVDQGAIKQLAVRDELERTGTTPWAWAVGRSLCPERTGCPSGLLALFELTKRGRLPVHRGDYGPRCEGSGKLPAVVLHATLDGPADGPSTSN